MIWTVGALSTMKSDQVDQREQETSDCCGTARPSIHQSKRKRYHMGGDLRTPINTT